MIYNIKIKLKNNKKLIKLKSYIPFHKINDFFLINNCDGDSYCLMCDSVEYIAFNITEI